MAKFRNTQTDRVIDVPEPEETGNRVRDHQRRHHYSLLARSKRWERVTDEGDAKPAAKKAAPAKQG